MTTARFPTLIGTTLLVCLLVSCSNTSAPEATTVRVHAGNAGYQTHPETEFPWYGTLQAANRANPEAAGLLYRLAYGDKTQLIHTGRVIPALEPLIGEKVIVRGKLVGTQDYAPVAPGSELWAATIATFEAQLVSCDKGPVQPEKKYSPYLADLLRERPGEQMEGIGIGFCDNLEITPYSSVEELSELRAPLYAKLGEELDPYIATVSNDTFWLTQYMTVRMQLRNVPEIAKRRDVRSLDSTNNTAPPP